MNSRVPKTELEKRLEGMDPANQIRELIFVLEDMRKDIAEIRKFISEEMNALLTRK